MTSGSVALALGPHGAPWDGGEHRDHSRGLPGDDGIRPGRERTGRSLRIGELYPAHRRRNSGLQGGGRIKDGVANFELNLLELLRLHEPIDLEVVFR